MRRVSYPVCSLGDIPDDRALVVSLGEGNGECAVLFVNSGEPRTVAAIGSLCPHQNASLHDAAISEGVVTCRLHGYRFDVKTGDCLTLGGYGIPVYTTAVVSDIVYVSYWNYDDD